MRASAALRVGAGEWDSAAKASESARCRVAFLTPEALLADTALLAEWDDLSAHAAEPNPFAECWYLVSALAALESDTVRIAVVRDAGLIGIIPLLWQGRYARLPVPHMQNWSNHNAFLDTPLVRNGAEFAFWTALLNVLDSYPKGALFLHLAGLAVIGRVAIALEAVCHTQNRRFALVHREERALLERGLSPDDYWQENVRGKKRKELRRQHKRLAEEGRLTFERGDGSSKLDQWIADFLALERAGWKGANGSALDCAEETRALFCNTLMGAAAAGKLELLAHHLDGRPIAMLVNFITPPAAFSFKTAFDENFARFSPGVLLQYENLALLKRDGIEYCDSCAAEGHPMIDSLWTGRRSIGRYSVAIGGSGRRAVFGALLKAELARSRSRKSSLPTLAKGDDE